MMDTFVPHVVEANVRLAASGEAFASVASMAEAMEAERDQMEQTVASYPLVVNDRSARRKQGEATDLRGRSEVIEGDIE